MKMYAKVMAVAIACMLVGGEFVAASTTAFAMESMGW